MRTQGPQTADRPMPLCAARVHEAEGAAHHAFAAYQALQHPGPVVWVAWEVPQFAALPPALQTLRPRLHLVEATSEDELVWATEEALRAAPVGLVIAEPRKPLSLIIGRRLQLAAEAGQTTGLMLIRTGQGSPAAETRWHCEPVAGEPHSTRHRWSLIKNKKGTIGDWVIDWDGKTSACHMVPKVCE